jgi:hypothetical protein
MKPRVSFQLYFTEGEKKGKGVEVMDVDLVHWDALKQEVIKHYVEQGILTYMKEELPIYLERKEFLQTEAQMRKIDEKAISEDAYIALFSLDIFLRQLEDLMDSDIRFELIDEK